MDNELFAKTYRLHKNVSVGENCRFGDFSIVGVPSRGQQEGEVPTILGNNVEIQSHVIISAGNTFGNDCIVGHGTFMRHNNRFGNRVKIGANNVIERDNWVEDDVVLETHSGIPELSVVEQGVWIGSHVSMASVLHPLCSKAKECTKGPHLERGVTIDNAATIYPDVRIGEGSYIEPGAVVIQNIPPYSVVSGSYGKIIGDIFTLYPERLKRIESFIDISAERIAKSRAEFNQNKSLSSI
jgi:acetyltransferase-like isoleucine patch superfamily enzyme